MGVGWLIFDLRFPRQACSRMLLRLVYIANALLCLMMVFVVFVIPMSWMAGTDFHNKYVLANFPPEDERAVPNR